MRSRRVLVAGAVAAMVASPAALLLAPLRAGAVSQALCPLSANPQVTAVNSPNGGPPIGNTGTTVTVTGSGLSGIGCQTTVAVGTTPVPASSLNVSGGSITFPNPGGSGAVVVTLTDITGNTTSSNSNLTFYTTPVATGLSAAAPAAGAPVTVNGHGFNFNVGSAAESETVNFPCTARSVPAPYSDTAITTAAPQQYCNGAVTVSLRGAWDTNNPSGASSTFTLAVPGGFDVQPTGVSLATPAVTAGATAQVHGVALGPSGTATLNSLAVSPTWSDTSVSFTVPDNATSGAVSLRRVDGVVMNPGTLSVGARVDSVSPAAAYVGQTVTVSGGGFGGPGSVAIGTINVPSPAWSAQSISFAVPAGATSGPLNISPAGTNPPAAAPSLVVAPHITSVSPATLAPGTPFQIIGTTFGTKQPSGGQVLIGGVNTPVTLWADQQIVGTAPSGVASGPATLVLKVPGMPDTSFAVTIPVPPAPSPTHSPGGPTPKPGATPSAAASSSSAASSPVAPGLVQPSTSGPIIGGSAPVLHKPPVVAGPVGITITSAVSTTSPGKDVPVTVTLKAFGQPVSGSEVDLVLVYAPARDASVTPATAVTDASGEVHGTLHMSKTAGEAIVLARSGQYSDEVAVTSNGAAAKVATAVTGGGASSAGVRSSQTGFLIGVAIVAALLFAAGLALRLLTPGAAVAVAGAGVAGAPVGGRRGRLWGFSGAAGSASRRLRSMPLRSRGAGAVGSVAGVAKAVVALPLSALAVVASALTAGLAKLLGAVHSGLSRAADAAGNAEEHLRRH